MSCNVMKCSVMYCNVMYVMYVMFLRDAKQCSVVESLHGFTARVTEHRARLQNVKFPFNLDPLQRIKPML